jgi:serine phosphatase RsbU (regulator of sigma subunit)
MNNWNIAIIVCPGAKAEARAIQRRLEANWNSLPEARFKLHKLRKLDQSMMEQLDAVVLLAEAKARQPELVRPLTLLDEMHIPVLAMLDGPPESGGVFEYSSVLIENRSTNGAVICSRLHGMMHRQREVNRLRHEVTVSRLSHGGLGDEVEKMHDELQLAAHAQRELLPRELPSLHGVSVAALWRPAQWVSGDIYDVLQLDEDRIGLFLADAVGHGVTAALMTMVISQSLTTSVTEGSVTRILEPGEVLGRLNGHLLGRRMHPSRFATAVYAIVDCRRRVMTVATAGHPPPFLIRKDGEPEYLDTSGGLLGVFEDEKYQQIEVPLSPGDRLLLYTDGFEQAFPGADGEPASRSNTHYRTEFEKLREIDNPQEMIDAICRRLDMQQGSLNQADDLTLLCVQAEASSQGGKIAA